MEFDLSPFKLNQLGEIKTGKTPPGSEKDAFIDGETPFITPKDMNGRKWMETTERYLSQKGLDTVESYLIPSRAVCVSCIGSDMGKVVLAFTDSVTNQQINSIIVDENQHNAEYIYYSLSLKQEDLKAIAGGSATPILNKTHFGEFTLFLPKKEIQDKVVEVLTPLDNKSINIKRVNSILISIAQTLFKSWFVDFDPVRIKVAAKANGDDPQQTAMRAISGKSAEELQKLSLENRKKLAATADLFPDEMAETEHGEIPKGWEWKKLGGVTSFLSRGLTPKYADDGVMVINQRCIRNHTIDFEQARFHDENQRPIKSKEVKVGDVLVNSTGVGTLGRVALVKRLTQTTTVDTHVTIVRADSATVNSEFLGYFMLDNESLIESMGEGSTGQTELKRTKLQEMLICIPNKDIQDAFSAFAIPMINNISTNELESLSLRSLRDTLLPKLLSGDHELIAQ